MKKRPSLLKNPQLVKTYTRERWIQEAYDKNKSEPARDARISALSRLDHYCIKVHKMSPEKVFEWMKKESKTTETLTQFAIDFLSKYVKFCRNDHPDIIINKGRNPKKNLLNKNNFLHKLHDNSILGNVASSRGFMSQVGGIRIHNDDMKRVPIPTVMKKGLYDDEEAEPLTAIQARNVIGRTRDHRSIVLYYFMNDTAFRISEAGLVIDSDFDLSANPPTVKCPSISIKGVKTNGVRFLRNTTANLVKTLLKDDDEHFTFRNSNEQKLTAFRKVELKKIKHVYDALGMDAIYEDSGRRKYNLHSWRKRCGTEYSRSNNESMADGYLRHTKYLAQYHIKTKEERIEAFRKAEIDLAIDESEKQGAKIRKLENEKAIWLNEYEDRMERINEKIKAEIIKELNDPKSKIYNLPLEEQLKHNQKREKRIRDSIK